MENFSFIQLFKDKSLEIKAKFGEVIILFRMGDLYTMVEEDAEIASEILGLSITISLNRLKSTAFPENCLNTYLPKLVRAGHRICICDGLV